MSSVLSKETCMRWSMTLNVIFMVLYIQVCTKIGTFVLGHFPQSDVHRIDCEPDLLNIADLLCDVPSEYTHQVLSNELKSDLISVLATLIARIHASRTDWIECLS